MSCMAYVDAIEEIKKRADELGYSQLEISNLSSLSTAQVSRIFSLKSTASQDTLVSLARAVKLSPNVIIEISTGTNSKKTAYIQQIDYIVTDLPEDEQVNVLEYARLRQRLAEEKEKRGTAKRDNNAKRPPSSSS